MPTNNLWGSGAALQHAHRRIAELEKQLSRQADQRTKDAEQYGEMWNRMQGGELKIKAYEDFVKWVKEAYPEIINGYEAVKKLEEFATQPDVKVYPAAVVTGRYKFGWNSPVKVWFDEMTDHDSLT